MAGSTICANPETSPLADATPATASTVCSSESGTGLRSSVCPPPGPACSGVNAETDRTTTSLPAGDLPEELVERPFIVSVSTKVPATNPTPSTMESAVSASRSFRAKRLLRVACHMGDQASSDFSRSRIRSAVGSRISSTTSPSAKKTIRSA